MVDATQNAYKVVKDTGVFDLSATGYKFNLERLAIDPLLSKLNSTITNPGVREQFNIVLNKIASASEVRDFGSLLDLRAAITEFKHSKKTLRITGRKPIDDTLANIDREILEAARKHMPEGTKWFADYKATRLDIAKMAQLKDNLIYKGLTAKGASPADVVKKSIKYLSSQDGTFEEISSKLSPKLRTTYEAAMVHELSNKYAISAGQGVEAIDWVKLSRELETKGFRDPAAKESKRLAKVFSEVFQNDVSLAAATKGITIPKFQSFLTVNPVTRLQFEVASSVWNNVRRLGTSDKSKYTALVTLSAKFMRNPSNLQTMKQLRGLLKADPQLLSTMEQMHIAWAQKGVSQPQIGQGPLKVELWGPENASTTKGPITEGSRYFPDRKVAERRAGDVAVTPKTVSYHRVAKFEDIETILGVGFKTTDIRTNKSNVIGRLRDKGFLGINVGDKVVMFPDAGSPSLNRGTFTSKSVKPAEATYTPIRPELPKGNFNNPNVSTGSPPAPPGTNIIPGGK